MGSIVGRIKLLGLFTLLLTLMVGCSYDQSDAQAEASGGSGQGAYVTDKERSEIKIGFSAKDQSAPFYVAMMREAERFAKEEGFQIITADAQNDMTKQISDINDMITQQVDMLLIDPADKEGLVQATLSAKMEGIPVVIVDNTIADDAEYETTIISDNYGNGILVGEWIVEQMGKNPIKVGLISGQKGQTAGLERRQGVIEGITEAQLRNNGSINLEVVAQGWGNWTQEGGMSAMEDIIVANPDINLLISENDSMALGARLAIEQAGKKDQILIAAAADGQKEALELIKKGEYGVTGINDPALVTRTGLQAGLDILEKGSVFPKLTYTPAVAITIENVDEFYDPDSDF